MCGITALLLADQNLMASPELFEGLGMLQHRGQACQPYHSQGYEISTPLDVLVGPSAVLTHSQILCHKPGRSRNRYMWQ